MDLPLLEWLEKYTFPSEAKFENAAFAKDSYKRSVKRHLHCGTTFASYFATIHDASSVILGFIYQFNTIYLFFYLFNYLSMYLSI
jgi:guanine deaminase